MISQAFLKAQIARLLRLPFIPREPDDLKGIAEEYKRALLTRCHNEGECSAVVDALVDTSRERMLTPGDILVSALASAGPMGFRGCRACNFSGWRSAIKIIGGVEYDYSVACECQGKPVARESGPDYRQRAAGDK
jgi:hypothetical protein